MSFTDQKPHITTEKDCKGPWGGEPNGKRFRCSLCGYKFKPGDQYRWVCMSESGVINFKTCKQCDGPDVKDRWRARVAEFYSDKFWALR